MKLPNEPELTEDRDSREFQDAMTEAFQPGSPAFTVKWPHGDGPIITRHTDPPRETQLPQPLARERDEMNAPSGDQPSGRQSQSESAQGSGQQKRTVTLTLSSGNTYTDESGQQYEYQPGKGYILVGG